MKNPYANIPPSIWLLVTITLISRSGTMVLVFLPLYLIQQLGFSILVAGQIVSFYGFGELAGSYAGGVLADKLGLLRILMFSYIVVGFAFLSLIFFNSEITMMAGIFTAGFFTATSRPAIGSAISKLTTSDERSKAYALNYQAVNLGSAIGPALGGLLATSSYSYLFIAEASTTIIAAIALWIFFGKRSEFTAVPTKIKSQNAATSIWNDKLFLILLSLTLLIGLSFSQVFNVYPLFLKNNYHLSEPNIGLVLGINGVLIILFQMFITSYVKKFNTLKIIGTGGLLIGIGYLILPFYTGFYYSALSMAIITIGEMISMPLLFDYVTKIAPPEYSGRYMGLLITALLSLPLCITPNVSTYIYDIFGPTALWIGISGIGVIVFFGFRVLGGREVRGV